MSDEQKPLIQGPRHNSSLATRLRWYQKAVTEQRTPPENAYLDGYLNGLIDALEDAERVLFGVHYTGTSETRKIIEQLWNRIGSHDYKKTGDEGV